MNIFFYDTTFYGFLSALFDAYKMKRFPDSLLPFDAVPPLLYHSLHTVETTNNKYERVQAALKKKLSPFALRQILYIWLSVTPERAMLLFRYLRKVIDTNCNIERHFTDQDVLAVKQLAKKISRERHYIMMLVRFNKSLDDIYFAAIAPRYNVLPLVSAHFKTRFTNQKWAIYDEHRGYGYFFDRQGMKEITLNKAGNFLINGRLNERLIEKGDKEIVALWQHYFNALTIKERVNPKLQRQYMPIRFWKYLPEMWTIVS